NSGAMQRKCCRQAANPTTDNDYLHGTSQKVSGTTQLPGNAARRVVETTENMTTATRSDLRTIAARCEMAISAARARIYRVLHGSSFSYEFRKRRAVRLTHSDWIRGTTVSVRLKLPDSCTILAIQTRWRADTC